MTDDVFYRITPKGWFTHLLHGLGISSRDASEIWERLGDQLLQEARRSDPKCDGAALLVTDPHGGGSIIPIYLNEGEDDAT